MRRLSTLIPPSRADARRLGPEETGVILIPTPGGRRRRAAQDQVERRGHRGLFIGPVLKPRRPVVQCVGHRPVSTR